MLVDLFTKLRKMKESNAPYITNLVNSIIGVSVLAMPFCMKQCGLLLGLGLLAGMSWLTYISCNMLITAAIAKRRRTYEYLAFYTVGPTGKFAAELSMIGLMLGTCIAFYVIIGDLATAILQGQVHAEPEQLRTFVIIFCGLCIALPLGLMKNVSVLGFIGFISLVFYCLFVCIMLANSISNGFLTFSWLNKVELFKPSGVFQCLPIFSLAYACQCQLFLVYDSLEDASMMRMEKIVTSSLKIVTFVYCMVAILGYATYLDTVEGNVLKNFSPNIFLDFIKLGFALSVVVGFPLMIFPCRQSIHTLFFSQNPIEGVATKTYIEPFLFKAITLCIVICTMTVALLIPNVETILGLTGATMGSFICFILPGVIFSKASPKEDLGISRFVLGVGCILLVLCTYSNVYMAAKTEEVVTELKPIVIDPNEELANINRNPAAPLIDGHRHEPAIPVEPLIPEEENKLQDDKKPIKKLPVPKLNKDTEKKSENQNQQPQPVPNEPNVERKKEEDHKNPDVKPTKEEKDHHQPDVKVEDKKQISDDLKEKEAKVEVQKNENRQSQKEEDQKGALPDEKKKDLPPPLAKNEDVKKMDESNQSVKGKADAIEKENKQPDVPSLNAENKSNSMNDVKLDKRDKGPETIDEEKLLDKIKERQKQQHELLHAEEALIKALEKKKNVHKQEEQVIKADKIQGHAMPEESQKKEVEPNPKNPEVKQSSNTRDVQSHIAEKEGEKLKISQSIEHKLPVDSDADPHKKSKELHRNVREVEDIANGQPSDILDEKPDLNFESISQGEELKQDEEKDGEVHKGVVEKFQLDNILDPNLKNDELRANDKLLEQQHLIDNDAKDVIMAGVDAKPKSRDLKSIL